MYCLKNVPSIKIFFNEMSYLKMYFNEMYFYKMSQHHVNDLYKKSDVPLCKLSATLNNVYSPFNTTVLRTYFYLVW